MTRAPHLRNAVLETLARAPGIDASAIAISAHDGVVTITGSVASYEERDAAVTFVRGVEGVHDVADELEVRPRGRTMPSDSEIAEAVRGALVAEPLVPQEQIQSTVNGNGHVTLTGTVSTTLQRARAEAVVRELRGVALVTNLLELDAPAKTAPAPR